jgi:UDP-N-acetylmuramate--alanine ligase
MHVYFSGIGGSGMSSLALLAKQAGYEVSGSDIAESSYIDYLRQHGINDINIGQTTEQITKAHSARPIDWLIYTPAVPITNPNHPELVFARQKRIKSSRQDDFINHIIRDRQFKLLAIAGTHGKSTTTAMAVWLFRQLGEPVSYSLAAKASFSDLSALDSKSQYFVLEADEFDRKFLSYKPEMAIISGIDWDHPDTYPSRDSYNAAFVEFVRQCRRAVIWEGDRQKLGYSAENLIVLDDAEPDIDLKISLPGLVNRRDAWAVATAIHYLLQKPIDELINHLNSFPGLSRRFEEISPMLYSDYAHTPPKIRGVLQLAREVAGDNVIVIYEGLHNTRQHFIKDELARLFDEVKQLYIVPSFLAREDKNLELLTPDKLLDLLSNNSRVHAETAELDDNLKQKIHQHLHSDDLVLALSAGGGNSLDEWLRQNFSKKS